MIDNNVKIVKVITASVGCTGRNKEVYLLYDNQTWEFIFKHDSPGSDRTINNFGTRIRPGITRGEAIIKFKKMIDEGKFIGELLIEE